MPSFVYFVWVWQSDNVFFLTWQSTGRFVTSHECLSPLLLSPAVTTFNQRLLTWLYMNDTVSPVPASLLSIKCQLCMVTTDDHKSVMSTLCMWMSKNKMSKHLAKLCGACAAVSVPVGGDWGKSEGTEHTLRHPCNWTSPMVAGWCLLIHTEGFSCAHCTCSGLNVLVCLS